MNLRQIILDTETTGLDPSQGHRIIEIGCIEMIDRQLTGKHFHSYLNPSRSIEVGAQQVHGITDEFLRDKPSFADVVEDWLHFIEDSELIIHNAPFDLGFLNHELGLLNQAHAPVQSRCSVFDTLIAARRMHPGQRNNLDALCRRYSVDRSERKWHGALLDAELLARVYLAMTAGQVSLSLTERSQVNRASQAIQQTSVAKRNRSLRVLRASPEELNNHEACLAELDKTSGGQCLWLRSDESRS